MPYSEKPLRFNIVEWWASILFPALVGCAFMLSHLGLVTDVLAVAFYTIGYSAVLTGKPFWRLPKGWEAA